MKGDIKHEAQEARAGMHKNIAPKDTRTSQGASGRESMRSISERREEEESRPEKREGKNHTFVLVLTSILSAKQDDLSSADTKPNDLIPSSEK